MADEREDGEKDEKAKPKRKPRSKAAAAPIAGAEQPKPRTRRAPKAKPPIEPAEPAASDAELPPESDALPVTPAETAEALAGPVEAAAPVAAETPSVIEVVPEPDEPPARPSLWRRAAAVLDRSFVLFLGIAVGAVIAASFFGLREAPAVAPVPPAGPVTPVAQTPAAPPPVAECAARFDAGLTRAVASGRPLHIGVFGDSFGSGIWQGLYLQFRGDKSFVVHQFGKQSTGFTRYQQLNLLDDIRGKVDAQPVDIAVISFGANDTQGIYADGVGAEYMSDKWKEIVGQRVDAVVQLLRDRGAMVYWVGLPKMRKPDFEAKVAQMNAFYEARMRALDVPFIDTVPVSVDAAGQYAAYLPDPKSGEPKLVRANDGIHMTGYGYGVLTRGLHDRIRNYVALARVEAERQAARRTEAGSAG